MKDFVGIFVASGLWICGHAVFFFPIQKEVDGINVVYLECLIFIFIPTDSIEKQKEM